jgi:hypothetical protein
LIEKVNDYLLFNKKYLTFRKIMMYKDNRKEIGMNIMAAKHIKITDEMAFDQDVKTMSYEELMETIRYLDEERQKIADRVRRDESDQTDEMKVEKRAA